MLDKEQSRNLVESGEILADKMLLPIDGLATVNRLSLRCHDTWLRNTAYAIKQLRGLARLRSQIVTSSCEGVSVKSMSCAMWSQFATGSGVVKKRAVRSAALSEMEKVGDGMIRENLAGLGYGQ